MSSSLPLSARTALRAWHQRFGNLSAHRDDPVFVAWASGRVNLIGEHTDYNDGWVLPAAIDRVVAIAGRPAPQSLATIYSAHHSAQVTFACDRQALSMGNGARMPLWARYVRATLSELSEHSALAPESGFSAAIAGDVPVGGGLSSSAALEVAVTAFERALGGVSLPPLEVALLCQRAEQRGVGVRVGVMDQATSCLGQAGQAILLDCRSLEYTYVPATLPGMAFAIFDTKAPHSLASSGYNERRAQCEDAVLQLAAVMRVTVPGRTITSLRDVTEDDLKTWGASLPDILFRRARHVVTENARTLQAVDALRACDTQRLGALLYASHASLRDDYEVSCRELDVVVEIARSTAGVAGARMMGAGFGGSALILVQEDALSDLEAALMRDYTLRTGLSGELIVCHIGGGPQWQSVLLDSTGEPTL